MEPSQQFVKLTLEVLEVHVKGALECFHIDTEGTPHLTPQSWVLNVYGLLEEMQRKISGVLHPETHA